jgi:NitT/TauT family transport system ATP-binding protein
VIPEDSATPHVPDKPRTTIKSIPTVALVTTVGLLEVLEKKGEVDLFELTQHVDIELTQLLMVVKAAELLGWIRTPDQSIEMTPLGRQFLAADINQRKKLLHQTLANVFVFQMVIQMLQHADTGEVSEETVLSQLALHFPHERPQRIFHTLVAWARYAELFKYSSTRKVVYSLHTT